jgi:hypothetical protein
VAQRYGAHIRVLDGESSTRPGVGTDPQDVINSQIGDEYDIFVGILWHRIGTPTPRARSGTAEEFARALKRFKASPRSLRVLLYFRTDSPPLSQIDPDQLKAVIDFKAQAGELGVLYREFSASDNFEQLLRLNLSAELAEFGTAWGDIEESAVGMPDNTQAKTSDDANKMSEVDEEDGLFDLMLASGEALNRATASLDIVGDALNALNGQVKSRIEQIRGVADSDSHAGTRTKRYIDLLAGDMEQFVIRARTELPIFVSNQEDSFDLFERFLPLIEDLPPEHYIEHLERLKSNLQSGQQATGESMAVLDEFVSVMQGLPRLTTRFNRGRRSTIAIIQEYRNAMNARSEATASLIRMIDQILTRTSSGA